MYDQGWYVEDLLENDIVYRLDITFYTLLNLEHSSISSLPGDGFCY